MRSMLQGLQNIREAAKKTGKNIGILLDTKGPEIRTHNMVNGTIELTAGTSSIISMKEVEGTPESFLLHMKG